MLDPTVRQRRCRLPEVELDLLEAGDPGAPLVVLLHGFPESAHSWRHQLPALAAAGYHAIAPDQRGYGRSSRPEQVTDYGIAHLAGDVVALIDGAGAEQAAVVGHDWGALIAWDLCRLHPERLSAVVGASVPFVDWPAPPTQLMRATYGDRFFYILYFQQQGPAETELEADVRTTMATVLWAVSGPGMAAAQPSEPLPAEGTGFLTAMASPPPLPYDGPEGPWLAADDLDTYVEAFSASGFFGPISYYRNLDANFALLAGKGADRVEMPSFFIGGALDPVLTMDPSGVARMAGLPDFRGSVLIPGAGHWVQQETPAAFNDALLGFLSSLR